MIRNSCYEFKNESVSLNFNFYKRAPYLYTSIVLKNQINNQVIWK